MSERGIQVSGLVKSFDGRPVLRGLSFQVAPGELVALVGPSGSGKTTLFRCLTRLIDPDRGEMALAGHRFHTLQGRALALARRDVGTVFQQYNLVRRRSALSNVLGGVLAATPLGRVAAGVPTIAAHDAALKALERVGLSDQAGQRADTLSGGQQQRVAVARALMQRAPVLLADEPVASLDEETGAGVLSLLRDLSRSDGLAILCSLHQSELARRFADRIVAIR